MGFIRVCSIELDQQLLSFQTKYLPYSKDPSGDVEKHKHIILNTSAFLFITTLILKTLKLISPLSSGLLCLDLFLIGWVAHVSLSIGIIPHPV